MRLFPILAGIVVICACGHSVPWKTRLSEDDVLLDLAKRRAEGRGGCAKAYEPLRRIASGIGDGSAAKSDEFWLLVSGCVSSYMGVKEDGGDPQDPEKALELCGLAARMRDVPPGQQTGVNNQCWGMINGWTFTLFERERLDEAAAFCRSAHALAGSPLEPHAQMEHWRMCLQEPDRAREKRARARQDIVSESKVCLCEETPTPRPPDKK